MLANVDRARPRLFQLVSAVSAVLIVASLARQELVVDMEAVDDQWTEAFGGPPIGSKLALGALTPSKNSRTLLVAASPACFSDGVMSPFYGDVIRGAADHYNLVGITDRTEPSDESAVVRAALPIATWQTVDFGSMHLKAPGFILVDNDSRVVASWNGWLSVNERRDIYSVLGLSVGGNEDGSFGSELQQDTFTEGGRHGSVISWTELQATMLSRPVSIIDVRERSLYERGHIAGSISMPIDEVPIRGRHEVAEGTPLVIVCGECPNCARRIDEARIHTTCGSAWEQFRNVNVPLRLLMEDPSIETRVTHR